MRHNADRHSCFKIDLKTFLSVEQIEGQRAQVLTASRVGPLALRLREKGPLYSGGSHSLGGGVGKRYYTDVRSLIEALNFSVHPNPLLDFNNPCAHKF